MLASTTSAASFSISSLGSKRGDRGRAIRPVRVDSRTPKGPISFMKESIREGLAELYHIIRIKRCREIVCMTHGAGNLHLNNAVVSTDIQHLSTELMSETGNRIQMLMLVSQSLRLGQITRVELGLGNLRSLILLTLGLLTGGGDFAVVLQQFLEELGTQDADLGEEELALHQSGLGVIEDSPDGDEIIELTTSLLDDAVLTLQDDGHTRQILDFGVTDDEGVDVEAASGQNTGHTGQDTGLVLHQTVQDVTLGRVGGDGRSFVENGRNGRGGVPLR